MLSEILKIVPKLDSKDLQAMQKALESRFSKLSKSFGKGLMSAIKGGGIAGIALGLIDKLLNPLKEVQEAIERTLKTSDDIATNAKQFNTTTGRLFKLVQLGKSTGLDQDNLFTLITKFQTAIAEAKQNPNNEAVSSVRGFVDQEDTAAAFFGFIQSLQKMDKNTQLLVQQQVFGEKQILKMADFLQTDFPRQFAAVGLDKVSTDRLTTGIEKLADLNDKADILEARRGTKDILAKSGVITDSMIVARDKSERLALQKENEKISQYESLATISDSVAKIEGVVTQGLGLIGDLIKMLTPFIDKVTGFINGMVKSPTMRGIFNMFGKGGD